MNLPSYSENWSGANVSVLCCVAGRAWRVLAGHTWHNVAPSLAPHFF